MIPIIRTDDTFFGRITPFHFFSNSLTCRISLIRGQGKKNNFNSNRELIIHICIDLGISHIRTDSVIFSNLYAIVSCFFKNLGEISKREGQTPTLIQGNKEIVYLNKPKCLKKI